MHLFYSFDAWIIVSVGALRQLERILPPAAPGSTRGHDCLDRRNGSRRRGAPIMQPVSVARSFAGCSDRSLSPKMNTPSVKTVGDHIAQLAPQHSRAAEDEDTNAAILCVLPLPDHQVTSPPPAFPFGCRTAQCSFGLGGLDDRPPAPAVPTWVSVSRASQTAQDTDPQAPIACRDGGRPLVPPCP